MSTLPTFTDDHDAMRFACHFLTELEDRVSREGPEMQRTVRAIRRGSRDRARLARGLVVDRYPAAYMVAGYRRARTRAQAPPRASCRVLADTRARRADWPVRSTPPGVDAAGKPARSEARDAAGKPATPQAVTNVIDNP